MNEIFWSEADLPITIHNFCPDEVIVGELSVARRAKGERQ